MNLPERHIVHLLSRVTSETTAWKIIGEQCDADIMLGLFLGDDNQEFRLSPAVLRAVSDRGFGMNIDIYALGDDDEKHQKEVRRVSR